MTPSPEVKAVFKTFVDIQREKYGPDWKEKLSKEMAAQSVKTLGPLLVAWQKAQKK